MRVSSKIDLWSLKIMGKPKHLPDSYYKFQKNINVFLNSASPSISAIAITLRLLQNIKYLDFYLKDNKYHIFRWSLEHDSLRLIQVLTDLPSPRRQFLMVTDSNYSAIENYINSILKLTPEAYKKISSAKLPILKAVIGIKPYPILELIKEITGENSQSHITNIFLQDIKQVTEELQVDFDITPAIVSMNIFHSPARKRKATDELDGSRSQKKQRCSEGKENEEQQNNDLDIIDEKVQKEESSLEITCT